MIFVGRSMEYTKLKNINEYKSETVNPMKYPDTVFEMYSVPIYDTGHPEYLHGSEIGSSKVIVRKNDVLICKINPRINRVWVISDESEHLNIASSEWIVVRSSTYNPDFLAWYFRSKKFKELMVSEVTGIGGSLTRAQPKAVAEYPVPIISNDRQFHIVSILNRINSVIKARKQELMRLDELTKARFVEMFGDPEFNNKGWPVKKLKDLCNVGSSKRIYQEEQTMTGVPFWRISDLVAKMDTESVESCLYIPESRYEELKSQGLVPEPGDILVTSRGTLGRCYIISPNDRFYFQDGMISWLSHYENEITPFYIQYLFDMPGFRKQIDGMQAGSTVAYLSIAMLKKLDIMLPSRFLQEDFGAFVAQVDKSKFEVQRSLDEAQTLFDSLMQEYFS